MRTIVKINNIWAEDLFKWFYEHIIESGGDGAGAIVCENYKECADWFLQWFDANIKHPDGLVFWHPKDESSGQINFHDYNENFIFTNHYDTDLGNMDYTFLVEGDCVFAFDKSHDPNPRTIKAIRPPQ